MLGSCVHLPLAFRCHVAEINRKLGFLARTKSALGYVSGAKYKASEMRRLVLNEAHRGRRRYKADHRGTNWVTMTESLVFFCGFPRFLRLFWLSDVVATMLPCVNTKPSSVSVHPSKSCIPRVGRSAGPAGRSVVTRTAGRSAGRLQWSILVSGTMGLEHHGASWSYQEFPNHMSMIEYGNIWPQ